MKYKISIIVPTLERSEYVVRFLKSLLVQQRLPDEVLIIDSSDSDKTKKVCEDFSQCSTIPIKYVYSPIKGITSQRNLGINNSKGDIIFFFDDDIVIYPNYISEIEKIFVNDSEQIIGGIGGVIEGTSSSLGELLGFVFCFPPNKVGKVRRSGKNINYHQKNIKEITSVQWLMGGCSAFRNIVFMTEAFSTFFEGYGLGEDREFSYRCSKKWKLVVTPLAVCQHLNSSTGRPNFYNLGYQLIRNNHYIFIKDIDNKAFIDYAEYIWSRIGLLLMMTLSLIRKSQNLLFVWQFYKGVFKGIIEIANGKWFRDYLNYT
jgi:glycosyltransferase involved in cell wall biosynthesis